MTERVGKAVTLWTRIRKMMVYISPGISVILTEISSGFAQSLRTSNRPGQFPYKSYPIHYLSTLCSLVIDCAVNVKKKVKLSL
jgi:hypothetical protein